MGLDYVVCILIICNEMRNGRNNDDEKCKIVAFLRSQKTHKGVKILMNEKSVGQTYTSSARREKIYKMVGI